MTAWLFTQYQAKTEPTFVAGTPVTEANWHQPWSEPVRTKIAPALAIALAASGLFLTPVQQGEAVTQDKWFKSFTDPVRLKPDIGAPRQQAFFAEPFNLTQSESVAESKWHQPWSEPLRFKPAIITGAQEFQFQSFRPIVTPTTWYAGLSEPVRQKKGLGAWLQDYDTPKTPPQPLSSNFIQWFDWLSEPVRQPMGLKAWLQHYFEAPPRWLPTPNLTVTMAARETNSDVALIGIYVYDSITPVTTGTSANVSISEVPVENNAAASLRES